MKTKDQIILGIEDLKNMRFPFTLKVIFYCTIIILAIVVLYSFTNNYQYFTNYNWIPVLLIIQTIIILFQLKIIWTQAKYQKIPYIPEFNLNTRFIRKSAMHKKNGFQTTLKNEGNIAHRVNCKIIIGKGGKVIDKLFFEKISKGGMEILQYIEEERFIIQPIIINFSYYDMVGNHIFSRWF